MPTTNTTSNVIYHERSNGIRNDTAYTAPIANIGTINANNTVYSTIPTNFINTVISSSSATISATASGTVVSGNTLHFDSDRIGRWRWEPISYEPIMAYDGLKTVKIGEAEFVPYTKDPFDELCDSGEEDPEMTAYLDSLKAEKADE